MLMHSLVDYRNETLILSFFFFFNDTATTEIYTLSLHDALPISSALARGTTTTPSLSALIMSPGWTSTPRSEEHTSELQSQSNLVCRLLLEKKKKPNCQYVLVQGRSDHLRLLEYIHVMSYTVDDI